jgi:hypothetical protein
MIVGVSNDPNAINPELQSDPGFIAEPQLANLVKANISEVVDGKTGAMKGYHLFCWRRDASIKTIPSSQSITDAVDLFDDRIQVGGNNYYAVYQAIAGTLKFYRNYDDSDITIVPDGIRVVDYITSTLGSKRPTNPIRIGYDFLGWARTRAGTIEADNLSLWDAVAGQRITEFYAIWKQRATIWVRENGVWVKKLNVREYKADQSTWEEKPSKVRSSNSWIDAS